MSVLTELEIPAEEFVLADTITASPDMRIEIKRVVASQSRITPYFWAAGGDFEMFEQALHADAMIADVERIEAQGGELDRPEERFYRVTWEMKEPNLLTAIEAASATVLEAVTTKAQRWGVKILFPDDDSLSAFHDYCVEHDFSYVAERIYRPENPQERGEYDLTEEQIDALEAAFHGGYFEVPREQTLSEIASDLGISRNALSNRLRRGHRNLLANTIVHDE